MREEAVGQAVCAAEAVPELTSYDTTLHCTLDARDWETFSFQHILQVGIDEGPDSCYHDMGI